MPEETRSFIEGECLRVARLQPGCKHLKAIAIPYVTLRCFGERGVKASAAAA